MANNKNGIFDLKEVKIQTLEGEFVNLENDKEAFAQLLYANAKSLKMDMFAREIFKHGKAEISEEVKTEIKENGQTYLNHRVYPAVMEQIEKQ